ncbi:AzlC family ABC transporter permease [Skermania piniformis]|uniref:AzlC family ABC transporter permease n=1 Tax=Skermania pinensis TaxID=39122 RepID=A0ABX8S983_9ACTN|nr:AzlC family ABC transporter permease [Skermania piniformis]QXQ13722.1 AzlC family ABC transporter permease [Skermania piniformis]
MRSILRTVDRQTVQEIGLVCLADGVVGVSFGVIAVAEGFPVWLPMALSVLVFAGAAQFLFLAVVAGGGSPLAAALAGVVVNARHLPFGLAVADALGPGRWQRLIGAHLITDESAAFTLARVEPGTRRAVFWLSGLALFVGWNAGVLAGVSIGTALAGTSLADPAVLGLDAAFPAVLLALVLPALREPVARAAALLGAGIAVPASAVLPAGVPVLLALLGLVLVPLLERAR